jgi:hypothetical protein
MVYGSAKTRAEKSGAVWLLTFDEWCDLWNQDYRWYGRKGVKMVRIDESLPFQVGNIKFAAYNKNGEKMLRLVEWRRNS